MKNRFLLFFLILVVGCKPFYNSTKIYFDNEIDLLQKSKSLNFDYPFKINFVGDIDNNEKVYKVNGFIKVESKNHYQIFLFSKTFGIELCRIDYNVGELIFIDKINKQYFKAPIIDFKYFGQSKLLADNILQVIFGRAFDDVTMTRINNMYSYMYHNYGVEGNLFLYNFGFVKTHSYKSDSINFQLFYANYSTNDIPTNVNGSIDLNTFSFNLNLNFNLVKNQDIMFEEFIIPNHYKEIL